MLIQGRQRLMPALAALSLALALSAGIGMMVLGFRVAVDQWVDQLLRADVYVTSHDVALDGASMDAVAQWPGVAAVTSVRQVTLSNGLTLLAYDLNDAAWRGFHWLAGDPDQARQAFMAGEALIVTEALARRQGWRLGEIIDVPSPSGPLRLPMAGIYQDYSSDQGALAMAGTRYRQHWPDDQRDSLGVILHPETSAADLRAWLDDRPEDPLHQGVTLTTRDAIREQTMAVFDRTFRISWAMAVLVALIASVALISALLALGLERARDYATLRALGMDQAHLRRFVRWQTTALAGTAALLAVPMAMVIHVVLSQVIQPLAFGWRIAFNLPMVPLALMFGLALGLGLMAGLYPGWAIARRDPAPLLRSGSR
jgi:putative ABC transport system permease protein